MQLLPEDTVARYTSRASDSGDAGDAVVAQALHLEQVTINFRNRYGSLFSEISLSNCTWWYVSPSLDGYRQQRFESLD